MFPVLVTRDGRSFEQIAMAQSVTEARKAFEATIAPRTAYIRDSIMTDRAEDTASVTIMVSGYDQLQVPYAVVQGLTYAMIEDNILNGDGDYL